MCYVYIIDNMEVYNHMVRIMLELLILFFLIVFTKAWHVFFTYKTQKTLVLVIAKISPPRNPLILRFFISSMYCVGMM